MSLFRKQHEPEPEQPQLVYPEHATWTAGPPGGAGYEWDEGSMMWRDRRFEASEAERIRRFEESARARDEMRGAPTTDGITRRPRDFTSEVANLISQPTEEPSS